MHAIHPSYSYTLTFTLKKNAENALNGQADNRKYRH